MYGEALPSAFWRLIARNRRRYGGYIVHAGIVVMFAAFAGNAFRGVYGDVRLGPGETFRATDPYGRAWTFTNQGISQFQALNRHVTGITLATTIDGKPMPLIKSEKRQHVNSLGEPSFEPSTEAGILESARQDVYVVLAGVVGDNVASLSITFNPLVVWVWIGGVLMAIGGLIVMWPQADRRREQSGYVAVLRPQHARAAHVVTR
jgi:cytochrome c-type biogenesis protein CcmF